MEGGQREERRQHERVRLRRSAVGVRLEPRIVATDVSDSGIGFWTNIAFEPGEHVHLVVDDVLVVEARVVECRIVESHPGLLELVYHVHCAFLDATHGRETRRALLSRDDGGAGAPDG